MAQPRLLLIDASSSIYRAFYALPGLRSAQGVPTSAVLGFATMLAKLLREEQPGYAAVVWDSHGPTRRHAAYAAYKAQRDVMPDDLRAQLPYVRRLVAGYRLASLEHPGEEADDVIATLAARAVREGLHVTIVSTDRDLMQLISEQIELLDTMKGRRYDAAEVEKQFGVPPRLMLDFRALTGDSSDNIPGVRGIGEKGAAALLLEYGDLDALLAAGAAVRAKRPREALAAGRDDALLSRELARLRLDVPVPWELDVLRPPPPDLEALRALFQELDLRRLLEGLPVSGAVTPAAGAAGEPSAAAASVPVELIEDEARLVELVSQLGTAAPLGQASAPLGQAAAALGVWPLLEPEEPMRAELLGVALAVDAGSACYVPLAGPERERRLELLAPLFENPQLAWCGGALKDLQVALARLGRQLAGPLWDVVLAAYVDDPGQTLRPELLAKRYLGLELPAFETVFGSGVKRRSPAASPAAELAQFAGQRAAAAHALVHGLRERLHGDSRGALLEQLEVPLAGVLARMELAGVRVDEAALARFSSELGIELGQLEQRIYALAGGPFNIGSPKQLQHVLFEKLALPPSRRTKTGFSTDESVLEELALEHDIAREILGFRHLSKLKSTYLDALPPLVHPETGRIHCRFNQAGASTGRLSTSNPNLQNIPVRSAHGLRIREAFVPAEGCLLLSADYSQIELRILAHCAQDPVLLEVFRTQGDVHTDTAARVFGLARESVSGEQRAQMKAVNFGILYGSSAFGLARTLGISQASAAEHIRAYFERFPRVREYLDGSVRTARERGYAETLFGRRRYLPDLDSRNRAVRAGAERMAMNAALQGTAADLIKRAMVRIDGDLQRPGAPRASMILQVHDELLFEVQRADAPALAALVAERMQSAAELSVPLVVQVGQGGSWREAH